MTFKQHTMMLLITLCTLSSYGADKSKSRRRSKRKSTQTMDLKTFHDWADRKNQLVAEARDAEQLMPTHPKDYKRLTALYTELIPMADSPAEKKRWQGYQKDHARRHAIMQRLHNPENQVTSSDHSMRSIESNLRKLRIQLNYWKKLHSSYHHKSDQYSEFGKKVAILETAIEKEESELKAAEEKALFELNLSQFQRAVQAILRNDSPDIANKHIHNYAETLFGPKTDEVIQSSFQMKQLAMKLMQQQWQKLAQQDTQEEGPSHHRISPEEHRQLKIKTNIAIITAQKDIEPLARVTALATLYTQLAETSSDVDQEIASKTAQHYTNIKERLLHKSKLNILIKAEDDITAMKEAAETAYKIRDSYPTFHKNYAKYEQIALIFTLKIAYLEQDTPTIHNINQYTHHTQVLNLSNRIMDRLAFEKSLNESSKIKGVPYEKIRNKRLKLMSTYDASDTAFQHYCTKLIRGDLRHEISQIQDDEALPQRSRYQQLINKYKQLLQTYPQAHPKNETYTNIIKAFNCLKQIEIHKIVITNNENKTLNKLRAFTLQRAYEGLARYSSALFDLTSKQLTEAHHTELRDLAEKADYYKHQVTRFNLYEKLIKVETTNHKDHKQIIKILDELIALPIVSTHEKDELTDKRKMHKETGLKSKYSRELRGLEKHKEIPYKRCIKRIKKLRKLSNLSMQDILLLEKKLEIYQAMIDTQS